MRKVFAGILAGIITLFAFTGSADAATWGSAGKRHTPVQSICETGYRGDPAYDRACLTRGTVRDAALLWFTYEDARGRTVRIPAGERRDMCRDARSAGSVRRGIADMMNDPAYDRFTNYRAVIRWAASIGVRDCKRLGVK